MLIIEASITSLAPLKRIFERISKLTEVNFYYRDTYVGFFLIDVTDNTRHPIPFKRHRTIIEEEFTRRPRVMNHRRTESTASHRDDLTDCIDIQRRSLVVSILRPFSQVFRIREIRCGLHQIKRNCDVITYSARGLNEIGDSPGGAPRTF